MKFSHVQSVFKNMFVTAFCSYHSSWITGAVGAARSAARGGKTLQNAPWGISVLLHEPHGMR